MGREAIVGKQAGQWLPRTRVAAVARGASDFSVLHCDLIINEFKRFILNRVELDISTL